MMRSLADLVTALSASAELSLIFKLTLATAAGLTAAYLTRRARASLRHIVLTFTILVSLALPVASALLPPLDINVPVAREASQATTPVGAIVVPQGRPGAQTSGDNAGERAVVLPSPRTAVRSIWAIGASLLMASLALALWHLHQLRRRGLPWLELRTLVAELAAEAGIRRRVDVLMHEEIPAPLTCGLVHPAIILPADARTWSEAAMRRALVHELEHVRRLDWSVHLVARVASAIYWFHPLVWIACRQLALEAERAADDAVLTRDEGPQYADQLVSLARRMAAHSDQPALGMAHRSDLSARVTAVLDRHQPRGRAGWLRAAFVATVATALVLTLSPLRAVEGTSASPAIEDQGARRGSRVPRLDRELVEAVESGDLDEVVALVDEGANINAAIDGDGSPLIVAAREGEMAIVTLLLDRGANPNLAVDGDGNPLIMAAREGHTAIVELLLNRGAHVDDVVPEDENALIQASGEGHLDVVKLLVARGANVNARVWADAAYERPQGEWRTPLSMARRSGRRAVVEFLVSVGATE